MRTMTNTSRSRIVFRGREGWARLAGGKGFHDDLEDLCRDRRDNGESFSQEQVVRFPRRMKYRTNPMTVGLRYH